MLLCLHARGRCHAEEGHAHTRESQARPLQCFELGECQGSLAPSAGQSLPDAFVACIGRYKEGLHGFYQLHLENVETALEELEVIEKDYHGRRLIVTD